MSKKHKTTEDNIDVENVENVDTEDVATENPEIGDVQPDDSSELDEFKDRYQRLLAEFDNYKKRTIKEKEAAREDARIALIAKFLPVLDNVERAEQSFDKDATIDSLKQGMDMVYKQILDIMKEENVESINALGEEFDPTLHNAVMHVEDDTCDINMIVDEFMKGYTCNDKVIRYSMVKVAN